MLLSVRLKAQPRSCCLGRSIEIKGELLREWIHERTQDDGRRVESFRRTAEASSSGLRRPVPRCIASTEARMLPAEIRLRAFHVLGLDAGLKIAGSTEAGSRSSNDNIVLSERSGLPAPMTRSAAYSGAGSEARLDGYIESRLGSQLATVFPGGAVFYLEYAAGNPRQSSPFRQCSVNIRG